MKAAVSPAEDYNCWSILRSLWNYHSPPVPISPWLSPGHTYECYLLKDHIEQPGRGNKMPIDSLPVRLYSFYLLCLPGFQVLRYTMSPLLREQSAHVRNQCVQYLHPLRHWDPYLLNERQSDPGI